MNPNKKHIFKTYLDPLRGGLTPDDNPDDFPTERIFISSASSLSPSVCAFTTETVIYINLASPTEPSLGDTCFATNNVSTPFLGNNRYYKIALEMLGPAFFARINNNGIIIEIGSCPIPI